MTYNYHEVSLMKDNSIKAVYDADLEMLLKGLYVFDDIVDGKCQCVFCGTKMTMQNIDGIIPQENTIVFSCNAPACRFKLVEEMNNK